MLSLFANALIQSERDTRERLHLEHAREKIAPHGAEAQPTPASSDTHGTPCPEQPHYARGAASRLPARALAPTLVLFVVMQHFTLAQRKEQGRAARERTSRSAHGKWQPAHGRLYPVALLEPQVPDRLPDLIPLRYGRMLASPFAFLRGAAIVMAHARAGDRVAIAACMGKSERFDEAVRAFAEQYADQTVCDHAALAAAVKEGRILAQSETGSDD